MRINTTLRNKWNLLFIFLLSFFLLSCTQNDNSRTIKTLKVAVLPDQSVPLLREKYIPLLEHIKERSNLPYELLIPDSYEQLLEWFINKKVDLAKFGGATYVNAHLKANASPLVMRDVDGRFRSVVLVSASHPATSLKHIKGVSFSFGSRLSTSGHLMPRYFFQQKNIFAESFFNNIQYSGAHDRTAEWVRDGKVEAGVANSGIVHEMFLDGRLDKNKIKVLWESPPYADYVWAIQPDISKKQKIIIRDIFLHINQDTEDKAMLKKLGANYFIPVSHDDFKNIEKIMLQIKK